MSNRKALCVGINQFKNLPNAALQGCVNDAHDMARVCGGLLGFAANDVKVLTDAQATKAGVVNELRTMVSEAQAGHLNYLVFSLSSHGTQVPDLSGDEPDRVDEAFCMHDLKAAGNAWDPATLITDDELHDLFIRLPKGVLLEVLLDTCHSGTGLKAMDMLPDRRPRFLLPPTPAALLAVEGKRSHSLARAILEKGVTHHVLWAACRADQTSADATIDGGWHGAFTYFFCKEISALGNKVSRRDLLAKIRQDLVAGHYGQTPQLECEATRRRARIE